MRWNITTEREKEGPRVGVGEDTLQQTIDHLRGRGDRTCVVHVHDGRHDSTQTLNLLTEFSVTPG